MDLVKRCQQYQICKVNSLKEQKDIDMKLDKKIVTKCSLEKAKFAILPSFHIPTKTSPQPNPVVQITVAHSWPPLSK